YAGRPPVADSCSRNSRETSAAGTSCAVATSGLTTLNVYVCVAEREPSLTFTVNVKSPAAVGVPESSPEELSVIPAGSQPHCTHQVWVPPPVAVNWKR